jgi:hypothetical protein
MATIADLLDLARLPGRCCWALCRRRATLERPMARAIWKGSISFGLVNVPVAMYAAVSEQDLHFHLIHTKDDAPIGYQKVCKKEDKPVPDDEIARAIRARRSSPAIRTASPPTRCPAGPPGAGGSTVGFVRSPTASS